MQHTTQHKLTTASIKVSASTSFVRDAATAGACTGSVCCGPACNIGVGDFHGCESSVLFTKTCQDNFDSPSGTLDVPSCDDVQVTLLNDPEGNAVYDIFHKPTQTYDRYKFTNCQRPSAGGQCTVTGGGCVSA